MIDFSFLHDGDYITIDNESELCAILSELEDFGTLWRSGRKPTDAPNEYFHRGVIRNLRYYEPMNQITFGTEILNWGNPFNIYKASEILQLRHPNSTDSDFEPINEVSLREFLSA